MRTRVPVFSLAMMLAVAACSKGADNQAQDQNISMDQGLPGTVANGQGNADVEALPADESSVTPSNQLQNGIDGTEVNDTSANAE